MGAAITITYEGNAATQALTVIAPLSEAHILSLLQFVVAFEIPTDADLAQFDHDKDGTLTITDAIFYARFIR